MNHATWSLGSTSMAGWRAPTPQQRRSSHTLSASPKGEKSGRRKKSQPCCCIKYRDGVWEGEEPASGPDNVLTVQSKKISKSPSAPNLHAGVTSILALQGSLTAFTAMAAANTSAENLTSDPDEQSNMNQTKTEKSNHVRDDANIETLRHMKGEPCKHVTPKPHNNLRECQTYAIEFNIDQSKYNAISETKVYGQEKATEISIKQKSATTRPKTGNKVNIALKETTV